MVVGITALFAADAPSAFDFNDPGQFLPYAIGVVLTIGVIAVGLALSGKKSTGSEQSEDGSARQSTQTLIARNSLERLVLPGLGLLMTCGIVGVVVLSVSQSFSEASKNIHPEAVQSAVKSDFQIPQTPAIPQVQPFQYHQPQINIPKIQPTMPRIPQVYVDSKGVIRSR
jgi:hypothetical protein